MSGTGAAGGHGAGPGSGRGGQAAARMISVVIGVGNPFRRDDGIGPAVAAAIERQHLPGVRVVISDGEPSGLIEAWSEAGLAVIVDALHGGPAGRAPCPGRIHRVTPGGPDAWPGPAGASAGSGAGSSHGLGLPDAFRLGRVLGRATTAGGRTRGRGGRRAARARTVHGRGRGPAGRGGCGRRRTPGGQGPPHAVGRRRSGHTSAGPALSPVSQAAPDPGTTAPAGVRPSVPGRPARWSSARTCCGTAARTWVSGCARPPGPGETRHQPGRRKSGLMRSCRLAGHCAIGGA